MKSTFALLLGVVVTVYALLAGASLMSTPVRAYSAGPDPALTGGFKEATCMQSGCHDSYELNAGKVKKLGDILIEGLPKQYEPGKTYPVKLTVTHKDGRTAWGFELAARLKATGAQAGSLKPADGKTQIVDEKGVQYIEHTVDGVEGNTFTFNWTAPAAAAGEVSIDAAANASDGSGGPEGDYIYTTSVTVAQ